MRVLIVAKTRMKSGVCIGGIATETGKSVRFNQPNYVHQEYNVGEIWEIIAQPKTPLIPPHTEDIDIHKKQRLRPQIPFKNLVNDIERLMPSKTGHPQGLYEGFLKTTAGGALYISAGNNVPHYSTTFWRPDQPLARRDREKKIRYHYSSENRGYTLPFVGFQEPIETIPASTLLRISLARKWQPSPDVELRHYAQLSGWFL